MRQKVFNNYKEIVDDIFGAGTIKEKKNVNPYNYITGALNNNQYAIFRNNFVARLNRLHEIYNNTPYLTQLIHRINNVADSKNWQGAFAELTTLDFFNYSLTACPQFLLSPVVINVSTDDHVLLNSSRGRQSNKPVLDGMFPDFNVFYDVKILQNTSQDILNGIYKRVQNDFPGDRLLIVPEYELDSSPLMFSNSVISIEEELKSALRNQPGIKHLSSRVVKGLIHNILRGKDMIITESGYNPYRHASEFWPLVYGDSHQFITDRPFFLVFLLFPWYNNIIKEFCSHNRIFYRSVSRRIFCGNKNNSTLIKDIILNKKKNLRLDKSTICDASKALSGILFLEDRSITANEPSVTNVTGYLYANPNALLKLTKCLFWDYAICELQLADIDIFEYDNY